MSLLADQFTFSIHLTKLFSFLLDKGYQFSIGEAQRTPEQQKIYVDTGRSKTMNSMHLKKCAIDLFIFKDNKLLSRKEELEEVGKYWESLSPFNEWGGNWRTFKDIPHFQRTVK